MTPEPLLQQLGDRTRAALDRQGRLDDLLAAAGDRPPAPGDLYLLPGAASEDVEWAVLDGDGEILLAVPADTATDAGADDITVPGASTSGPLTLRCAWPAAIDRQSLRPKQRSGLLEAPYVVAALRRVEGTSTAPRRAPTADATGGEAAATWRAAVAAGAVRPWPARPAGGTAAALRRWLPLAAVVTLALGAGGAAVVLDLTRRATQGRTNELPARPNLPFLWLTPREGLRGAEPPSHDAAEPLFLILEVPPVSYERRYRVEARDSDGIRRWAQEGLAPVGVSEVSMLLPAGWLPAGRYRLLLFAGSGNADEAAPLAEYELRLTRELASGGS